MTPWLLTALLLAAMPPAPKGVVLISVDTLRADHLGFMGDSEARTEALDRLARRGSSFRDAYSPAPATAPSHASLLTGLYPSWHGVGRFNGNYRLTSANETLASILKREGVATAAVVSNPILAHGLGLDAGFDRYDDRLEARELNRDHGEQRASAAVAKGNAELERLALEPRFLLWLHLQDPHGPYSPPTAPRSAVLPEESRTLESGQDHSGYRSIPKYQVLGDERRLQFYQNRYRDEIEYLDRELATLLDRIENDERFANTLVLLTSDHGESMGEDDYYFAHGHSVGDELLHVPLLLAGPGVPSGLRVSGAVSTISIFATILEFFEVDTESKHQVGSLFEILLQDEPRGSDVVYGESHNQVAVARGEAWLRRDRIHADPERSAEVMEMKGVHRWRPLPRVFFGGDSLQELELEELLRDFEIESEKAALAWSSLRLPREHEPSEKEIERLRSLGYLR